MGYSDFKEMFRDAKNLATGANDMQLKSVLLDIQGAVYELQEENRDLRDKIHDLENQQIFESELIYRNGVYLKGNEVFCSACWDKDHRTTRIRYVKDNRRSNAAFWCDVCKDWRFSNIPVPEVESWLDNRS